uniref:Kazal-like domain-containing protein n=1 Tax=Panagrellus redivivus TaxID=6233 RepID=A0A7E4V407_PANRE
MIPNDPQLDHFYVFRVFSSLSLDPLFYRTGSEDFSLWHQASIDAVFDVLHRVCLNPAFFPQPYHLKSTFFTCFTLCHHFTRFFDPLFPLCPYPLQAAITMNVVRRWTPSFLTGLLLTILVVQSSITVSHAVPIGMGDVYDTEFGEMMQQMQTKRALVEQVEAEGYIPIDRNSRDTYDYGIVKEEDSIETGPTSGRKREVEGPYRHVGIGLAQAEELFNEGAESDDSTADTTTTAPGVHEGDGDTVPKAGARQVREGLPEDIVKGPEDLAFNNPVIDTDVDDEEPTTSASRVVRADALVAFDPHGTERLFAKTQDADTTTDSTTTTTTEAGVQEVDGDTAEEAKAAAVEESGQRQPRKINVYTEKPVRVYRESEPVSEAHPNDEATTEYPVRDETVTPYTGATITVPGRNPAVLPNCHGVGCDGYIRINESTQRQPRTINMDDAEKPGREDRGLQPVSDTEFGSFGLVTPVTPVNDTDEVATPVRAIRNPVNIDGDKPKEYPDDKAAQGCNCDHDPKPTTTTTTEAPVTVEPTPAFADEDIIDEEDSSEEPVNVPTVRAKRSWYYFPSRG